MKTGSRILDYLIGREPIMIEDCPRLTEILKICNSKEISMVLGKQLLLWKVCSELTKNCYNNYTYLSKSEVEKMAQLISMSFLTPSRQLKLKG
jgi:hypothetical protein